MNDKTIHSQCKEIYAAAYPEYYWVAADGRNLNTLLKKIEKSIEVRQKRKATEQQIVSGFKYILAGITDWMVEKGLTRIQHFSSQYEQVLAQAKKNNNNGEGKYDLDKLKQALADNDD